MNTSLITAFLRKYIFKHLNKQLKNIHLLSQKRKRRNLVLTKNTQRIHQAILRKLSVVKHRQQRIISSRILKGRRRGQLKDIKMFFIKKTKSKKERKFFLQRRKKTFQLSLITNKPQVFDLKNLYKTSILREYPRFKTININRNKILRKKLAVIPDYLEMKRKVSTLFSTNKTKLSTIPTLIKKDILLREQLYATINENNVKNILRNKFVVKRNTIIKFV